jgi:hypothetical protein
MNRFIGLFSLAAILLLSSCNCPEKQNDKTTMADSASCCKSKVALNVLTDQEKAEGWQLLFDGKTIDQWHGFNGEDVSQGWVIEDECLKSLGHGGDIGGDLVTSREFENFELSLEWRIAHGGNSGILYGVIEDPKYIAVYYTGAEYQLLDDIGYPDKLEEWQLSGANYAMHLADKSKKKLQMVGGPEFNTSRLIVNGTHIEHWLNGEKVVEFERWTDDWNKRKAEGKWKDFPDYGMAKKGKLSLQDHGYFIWFRNIKIREL